MKNTSKYFLAIIFAAVLVMGAAQQGCNQQQGTTFNSTALTMSFVDQAPPAQVNPGVKVPIIVRVENGGGYDIVAGSAKFYLSGVGTNLKNVNEVLTNQNLLAKKTAQQGGGYEMITFAEQAEQAVQITNPFTFSIKADSCYNYATQAQATVCIGPGSGVCSITGEKIQSGSNTDGPIQVTSLTETLQGNQLFVSFKIENKGNGNVYFTDMDCDKLFGSDANEQLKQQLKKGFAEIAIETDPDMKCNLLSSDGSSITGINGMAQVGYKVTCTKTIGQETSSAPMKINLAYKYSTSASKSITLLPSYAP